MKNDMSAIVSLGISPQADGLLRVDVDLENAPVNLFGAAFHLEIEGAQWSLEKYETGDVFAAPHFQPIILASESQKTSDKPHEILFGLSLARGDEISAGDGRLVSFYLKTAAEGELKFRFEDAFLSVLEEQREDLGGIVWEAKSVRLETPGAQRALQASVTSSADFPVSQSLFQVYGVMAFAAIFFVVAGCTAAIFRLRSRNKR